MVLFFVSIVIAMLAAAAVMLLRLTNTDNQTAVLHGNRIQCDQLVLSAVTYLTVNKENAEQGKIEILKPFEVFPGGYFVIDSQEKESDEPNESEKPDEPNKTNENNTVRSISYRFHISAVLTGSTFQSKAAAVIDYSQKPPKVIQCVFQ